MASKSSYSKKAPIIDWEDFVVHPCHPRPRDRDYHDVLEALDREEERSAHDVIAKTGLSGPDVSRALRLLVKDDQIVKTGGKYVYFQ